MRQLISILFLVSLLPGNSALAQSSLSMYSMPNHAASLSLNPAWVPQDKLIIGLPFVSEGYFQSRSNEFVLSSLLEPNADSASLDLTPLNILDDITDKNFQNLHLSWQWISVGIRLGEKSFLTFSIRERLNFRSYLSPDLIRLAGEGNAPFKNASADLATSIHFDWYREYGLKIARQINEKLNVGAQVNVIDGISNIHTEKNSYAASFEGDYNDFSLNGSALFQTAGMSTITRNDSFRLFSTTPLRGTGSGFGVDLGIDYSVTEDFRLSASLINLGRISWKQDVKQIETSTDDYSFTGFDILDLADQGVGVSTEDPFVLINDSLKSILNLQDTQSSSYSTNTAFSIYLSGSYRVNERVSINGTYVVESGYDRTILALNLALPIRVNDDFQINPSYTISNGAFFNIGFAASYRIKMLQLYLATDNIPGMFVPQDTKLGHAQAGAYLTF